MYTFNIYLSGKKIDTVFYDQKDSEYVKQCLVDHDNYNYNIKVLKCWQNEYIVQGNYGYGYDDLCSSENYSDAIKTLKEYNENESVAHRIITRKVQI